MTDFKSAFKAVKKLSADFKANEIHFLSPKYSEADVRKDFIDKFFIELGWDVNHNVQKNPYEQEVKVEKTQTNQKRTDYSFFLSPNYKDPKFFVEAKKPRRNLFNKDDYFQTIRYGWNANTPIAVLTDFEEFHILDCRYKPDINSVLQNRNHKQYHYSDYADLDKFNEIYFLFSHEVIENNSLDKYADSLPKPKGKAVQRGLFKGGYQAIDEDFLEYIDETRETLAKAFKKNDTSLTSEELTEATQRTIDRLVFIRFLEDKLIEPDNYVTEFGKKGNAWDDFISVSRKLDSKYNGIVFKKHFIDERSFKGPDENHFAQVCEEISHLNSPYDFNAIPIHILGSIYERFLGKVVHATDKRVKVEEKPEVRKAGGVYYTPKYIVDYIVQNTVGKLIKGKTPEEISKMRFADIACGSGSFLIGVFECLLNYHNEYYQSHPDRAKKDGCLEKDGKLILSIKQKQNILLNNVYGVDIDQQATEVTQLSLALKMLEDETTATANDMQVLFHEKILPDLSKNIVCGNSLIGTDILSNNMFESEDERKLNPMDFENVFTEIMRNGGFDAVVGNPPYLSTKGINSTDKNYFQNKYLTAKGQFDLYGLFIEKSSKLLTKDGLFGYITSNTYLSNKDFTELRKYLIQNTSLKEIINFGETVFKDANLDVSILIFNNRYKAKNKIKIIINNVEFFNNQYHFINQKFFNKAYNNYEIQIKIKEEDFSLIDKLFRNKSKLNDFLTLPRGIELGSNTDKIINVNKRGFEKLLVGKNISSYEILYDDKYIMFEEDKSVFKDRNIYNCEKLLIQRIRNLTLERRIIATLDKDNYLCTNTLRIGLKRDNEINLSFFLGILNSTLINYIFKKLFLNKDIYAYQLERIPFPFNNYKDISKTSFEKIVSLVTQMLESKKLLHSARTDKDRTYYERKCESLDKEIDSEVYKLYDLTEEEIKIVEGGSKL